MIRLQEWGETLLCTFEQDFQKICRDMEKATVKPNKPWNIEITGVELEKKKEEYSTEELRTRSDQKIAEIAADVEIYTDGSR